MDDEKTSTTSVEIARMVESNKKKQAKKQTKGLQFVGIEDVFTSSRGLTKTLRNFVKVH